MFSQNCVEVRLVFLQWCLQWSGMSGWKREGLCCASIDKTWRGGGSQGHRREPMVNQMVGTATVVGRGREVVRSCSDCGREK
jgi:hypothetical protein